MVFKLLILLFVLVIFYCLGSALYYLIRDGSDSERMVKALTWRVILSVSLFVLLMVAYALGWVHPHTI
jgi:hypothetical protein